jgi:hypothetical protein
LFRLASAYSASSSGGVEDERRFSQYHAAALGILAGASPGGMA